MMIYRQHLHGVKTAVFLEDLHETLGRLRRRGSIAHGDTVRMLIDFGQFEAAVADLLSPHENGMNPTEALLRRVSLLTGHLFCNSWASAAARVDFWADQLDLGVQQIAALPLPERLDLRVAEGYAYYSLYPETYLEASRQFFREAAPRNVVCIGIRTIGTSLSAVVAAALEEQDCHVESCAVRCAGHPFDRRLFLERALAEHWASRGDRYYAVVDEGPGPSGSTLCCVAAKLVQLGVPEERIVLFPSHDTDASVILPEAARQRWPRHRKYTTDFEEVWVRSGRLASPLPEGELVDISAGRWRTLLFEKPSHYPAVQPSHERRKYLLRGRTPLLLKFAGLGRYGEWTCARAAELAKAGFHPRVQGLRDGFLAMDFVPGRPMAQADIDAPFLEYVARYLAHLRRTPGSAESMKPEEWLQMIAVNLTEGLGAAWTDRFRQAGPTPPTDVFEGSTDGRMLLHEWLRTKDGYLKTDGVDHYTDHFSPSASDSAWDIAACRIEWDLSPALEAHLIDRYVQLTRDVTLADRLPFHTVAYLAHRLGYTKTAAQTLGTVTPDGRQFEHMAHRYSTLLKKKLASP